MKKFNFLQKICFFKRVANQPLHLCPRKYMEKLKTSKFIFLYRPFYFLKRETFHKEASIAVIVKDRAQTTQTAHTLYLDRLSRRIVYRHAMLRFHKMFFDCHLTAICCIQGLSFTTCKA